MVRNYYKDPDEEHGRPRTRIARHPTDFSIRDTSGWDARRFLRELAILQGKHAWEQERTEWEAPMPAQLLPAPIIDPNANLIPVTDPDEVNRFLDRPPAVSQITSQERAAHALALGMILIAVDPNTPDLAEKLSAEAKDIHAQHPLPIKDRWRPSGSTDVAGIDAQKVEQWREHRIVDLYDLIIRGHDPCKERKQLAAWLFPEVEDRQARGKKLDRAVRLLNEALASMRMIDAQTR
jgi:hypothetical protein